MPWSVGEKNIGRKTQGARSRGRPPLRWLEDVVADLRWIYVTVEGCCKELRRVAKKCWGGPVSHRLSCQGEEEINLVMNPWRIWLIKLHEYKFVVYEVLCFVAFKIGM